MFAALIKAINDLLDFISAFREGVDPLEGERFEELDRAVWLSARQLNLQAELPRQRPACAHRGHTNLPGIVRFGAFIPFFLSDWKKTLADLRAIAVAQLAAESLSARKPEGSDADNQKRKRRGGNRPLEKRNPLQLQVYERIWREHRPGDEHSVTIDRLKSDNQFVEQIKEAGLKLDTKLVRKALDTLAQRQRRSSADNRQTESD